jgi:multidrug efflux pump subunit AcrA (membrane-fusion protein)
VDKDTNELVARLSTAAGIIMEDSSPIAVSRLPKAKRKIEARLGDLEQATRDANVLIQAAQVLTRRNIR